MFYHDPLMYPRNMGLNKPLLNQRLISPDHKALFLVGLINPWPFLGHTHDPILENPGI